jgi:hypothetical protein
MSDLLSEGQGDGYSVKNKYLFIERPIEGIFENIRNNTLIIGVSADDMIKEIAMSHIGSILLVPGAADDGSSKRSND